MLAGILFLVVFFALFYFIFFSKPPVAASVEGKPSKKGPLPAVKKEVVPVIYPRYTLLVVVALVIAQQVLLFETYFGIGWGIFAALVSVALLVVSKAQQRTPLIWSMTAATVVAAIFSTYWANGFIQSINIVFVCVVGFLLLFFKTFEKINWNGIWLLKYGILMIPELVAHLFRVIQSSTSSAVGAKKPLFSVMGVIKTVALTLIVLAVFIALLSNADPVFAQIIEDIWDTAVARVLTALLVAFVAAVFASMALKTKENEEFTFTFFSFWDVFVPVLAAGLLFGLFLAIQFRYLFGDHQDLALINMTYSEYVRKGFIELMWASLFGSLLTYFVYMKKQVLQIEWERQALKVVNVLFASELILLVASAFKRNLLYIEMFGLTRVRIIGNYFLVWLVLVALLLLAMTLWNKMRERHFLTGAWLVSALVVLALNVTNIDKLVFASSPKLDATKDFYYLANLSEDVAAEWKPMIGEIEVQIGELEQKGDQIAPLLDRLNDEQPEDSVEHQKFTQPEIDRLVNAKLALIALKERWEYLEKKYSSAADVKATYFANDDELPESLRQQRKLASLNWGEYRGYVVMNQDKALYTEQVPALLTRIDELQLVTRQDLYDAESRLMYDYNRPFVSTESRYRPSRMNF